MNLKIVVSKYQFVEMEPFYLSLYKKFLDKYKGDITVKHDYSTEHIILKFKKEKVYKLFLIVFRKALNLKEERQR